MAWDAVDFVIGSHNRLNASTLDHLLKRWEKILAQHAFGDGSRADIGSAFWLAVARQVLQCCKHFAWSKRRDPASALQAFDGCYAQFGCEIGVFAKSFLDPAPAWVAGNIDHR